MHEIKKILINTLATTCAVMLLLIAINIIREGIFAYDVGEEIIPVSFLLQVLGANTVIWVGLFFTRKFESSYTILNYFLDISNIIIVLLVFNAIFDWYSTRWPWILVLMAVILYIFGLLTNIVRNRKDAKELNQLLQRRRENIDPVT